MGFWFTHAIVCRIPDSFKSGAAELTQEIDIVRARKQHEFYCQSLRNVGLDVIELPPDEALPDSVFVEDTAVVCNGTALICKPGLSSRRKEVDIVRAILKKELELPIVDIADESALVDGGDILFTGREFFVGLSNRTNDAGARAVAAAFPEYPVTPVQVPGKNHLKSLISVAGPDILCVSSSEEAQCVLKRMSQEATYRYQMITVPDIEAANCLFFNGTLFHRAEFPDSLKVLDEKYIYSRFHLEISEIAKANGNLSRCCILIKKSKYM